MKYRYVTKTMAENAAKKGLKAAIRCSAKKWWWFGTCAMSTLKRHRPALANNCALCMISGKLASEIADCSICPLGKKDPCCTDEDQSTYAKAIDLYFEWYYVRTLTNFRKFQAKARKLARIIEKL